MKLKIAPVGARAWIGDSSAYGGVDTVNSIQGRGGSVFTLTGPLRLFMAGMEFVPIVWVLLGLSWDVSLAGTGMDAV
jgi:hypothetical protein